MAGLKLKSSGSGLDNLSFAGKVAVGLMFTVMVGVAYFVVFYGEIDSNITAQRQTLQNKKRELEKAKEADRAYNEDLTELERRRQNEKKLRKVLPDEAQSHAFLSSLQTVATVAGVDLTSWTPQDEVPQDFYAKVPMELKLRGKFHQVAKFFWGVGQVDRIINMENIVIKSMDREEDDDVEGAEREAAPVEVQALATAFRSLDDDESGGRRRGEKKKQ